MSGNVYGNFTGKTSAFERLLMRWEELLPLFLVNCGVIAVRKERGILSLPTKRRRHGADISATLLSRLEGLPVCSLSLDNGSEFAEFRQLEEALEAPIFFAEPHKPWQRGCNENGNGLLRFFFPKGCDFLAVSPEYFAAVIDLLNHRPRKRLGWRTPFEVFFGVALA